MEHLVEEHPFDGEDRNVLVVVELTDRDHVPSAFGQSKGPMGREPTWLGGPANDRGESSLEMHPVQPVEQRTQIVVPPLAAPGGRSILAISQPGEDGIRALPGSGPRPWGWLETRPHPSRHGTPDFVRSRGQHFGQMEDRHGSARQLQSPRSLESRGKDHGQILKIMAGLASTMPPCRRGRRPLRRRISFQARLLLLQSLRGQVRRSRDPRLHRGEEVEDQLPHSTGPPVSHGNRGSGATWPATSRTGAKDRRWIGLGPRRLSASRCIGTGYPMWMANP